MYCRDAPACYRGEKQTILPPPACCHGRGEGFWRKWVHFVPVQYVLSFPICENFVMTASWLIHDPRSHCAQDATQPRSAWAWASSTATTAWHTNSPASLQVNDTRTLKTYSERACEFFCFDKMCRTYHPTRTNVWSRCGCHASIVWATAPVSNQAIGTHILWYAW
jgi:hypothetical protein